MRKTPCPKCGQPGHSVLTCNVWRMEQKPVELMSDPVGTLAHGRVSPSELKNVVTECLKVLRCHHRNTHKPLIERLQKLKAQL